MKALLKPFKNKKGISSVGIAMITALSLIGLTFITWTVLKYQDIAYERSIQSYSNTLSDVIAEQGQLTSDMQTALYSNLSVLTRFGGTYTIQYQTYTFDNPNNKITLGSSKDGQITGDFTVPSGQVIRVKISTESSPLDRFVNNLFGGDYVGITKSSSYKVD